MQVRASKIRYRGTRDDQQDAVGILEVPAEGLQSGYIICVLTDGIGGLPNGRQASEIVNASVLKALADGLRRHRPSEPEAIRAAILAAAERANEQLQAYQQHHRLGPCGTTLVVSVLSNDWLHFLSVGDSLLLALSDRNRLARLNVAHTRIVEDKSYLASALLGADIHEIDQASIDLEAEGMTSLLLSSDGLEQQNLPEVTTILAGTGERKLSEIVELVHEQARPNQDNLSMILVEIDRAK